MSKPMSASNSLTMSLASGFVPGALARQRLCIFHLVFRKVVPKNFRKLVRKVLRVQIVFKIFTQQIFQHFICARSN